MRTYLIFICALASGCDRDRPETPTREEAEQLDEVGDLLDNLAANEKGPEAEAPDPQSSEN